MPSFNELVKKKVAGIPVVYLALAAVLGLALLAWKLKPTVTPPTTDEGTAAGGLGPESNPDYTGLETAGTVVVAPQPSTSAPLTEQSNDDWLRAAADYVANDAKLTTYGDAFSALSKYLDGDDLTYDEGKIRDAALAKLKAPPEAIGKLGVVGTAPAQKQFTNLPGKHTVKGSNDNTPAKLCTLYYGTADAAHVNKLVEHNLTLGPPSTTYSVGTVVTIPVHQEPHYYVVQGKNNDWLFSTVAAKYGLSPLQLQALNPGVSQPIPKGTKMRYV